MLAMDIMTTSVISVSPDTLVDAITQLLVDKHITAVPVIDSGRRVVGIISDSDLMHRVAGWPSPHESIMRMMLETGSEFARRTRKTFGQLARDIMTAPAITVGPYRPVPEIAKLLAEEHLRRVPVVADGKLVDIVSKTNLVQALASLGASISGPSTRDREIRDQVLDRLCGPQAKASHLINAIVSDGVAHLWGVAETAEEMEAHRLLAESITGVRAIKNHIAVRDLVPSDIAAVV